MTNSVAGLILMVVTSHSQLATNQHTGVWLEEFAVPYQMFRRAGYEVVVANPAGAPTPIDPRSVTQSPETGVLMALRNARALATINPADYQAVFFPGGHGTMFDFPDQPPVQKVVSAFLNSKRPIALVCHGPAALVGATAADGKPAVRGRKLTAFTNDEEKAVELEDKVPFLLQTRLTKLGAQFSSTTNFAEHVVVDGNLITGQNPASSALAARKLLDHLTAAR